MATKIFRLLEIMFFRENGFIFIFILLFLCAMFQNSSERGNKKFLSKVFMDFNHEVLSSDCLWPVIKNCISPLFKFCILRLLSLSSGYSYDIEANVSFHCFVQQWFFLIQGFVTDNERALEELFCDEENTRKGDACLNLMATRIATVFASLRVSKVIF